MNIKNYLSLICPVPKFLKKYFLLDSLKRLKNIGYFCGMDYASKEIYDFQFYVSRFDHSLSTALITWVFTKSKKETLAALFHDVSTPVFSHVIDYMNGDYKNQESTENMAHMLMINDAKLIKYLKEDELSIEDIIDFKKYSIVDNKRPKLCADRIDGIILSSLVWTKKLRMEEVPSILDNIEIFINESGESELGFKNEEIAEKIFKLNNTVDTFTHSDEDNYMMNLLSQITKYFLDHTKYNYEDLFILDEKEVMKLFEELSNTDKIFKKEFYKFKTTSYNSIEKTHLPDVKVRNINPLVNGKRFN